MKRRPFLAFCTLSFLSLGKSSSHAANIAKNKEMPAVHKIGKRALELKLNLKGEKLPSCPKMLEDQIRNDFSINNTVEIDGWILSNSEVKYCVQAYLGKRS